MASRTIVSHIHDGEWCAACEQHGADQTIDGMAMLLGRARLLRHRGHKADLVDGHGLLAGVRAFHHGGPQT